MTAEEAPWAIRLFEKSPLKQEKYRRICDLLGGTAGKTCLDIGSDNGVISYLLREKGGKWSSADLIPETVASIRELVGEDVFQINGETTPFAQHQFDAIVIVDFLEHIHTDRQFITELDRILKPGGMLIVNVPNPKEGLLRRIRFTLGQTDEEHGHVRPGYTIDELRAIMPTGFSLERQVSYSRIFSVLVDTVITFGLHLLKGNKSGDKGTVVTGSDMEKMKKSLNLFSLLYPFLKITVMLDNLFPSFHGNMLISRWKKNSAS